MYATRNDLSVEVRASAASMLQQSLADSVDLFTQVKQAHWNVEGPNFIALHELFDKIAEVVEVQSDLLAERITALGGRADGTVRTAAKTSSLEAYPVDIQGGDEHLSAIANGLAAFGAAVRALIDRAGRLPDADTADLFTQVSREIDKQLWFVEAHLQADR